MRRCRSRRPGPRAGSQLDIAIDRLVGLGGGRRVDPRPDRQARRRPGRDVHTVMVREAAGVIVPVQFAVFPLQPRWGTSPDAVRQALAAAVFGIVQRWVVEGKGVRSGERVAPRVGWGRARGMGAPGPAQPAPIPPSTPRSPAAARQGARLSASDPRGRREATGRRDRRRDPVGLLRRPGRTARSAGVTPLAGTVAARRGRDENHSR